MKLVLQTIALGIFVVGASAAIGSSYKTTFSPNHAAAFPVPNCNPGHPCTGNGNGK